MQLTNLFPIKQDLPINDVHGEPTGIVFHIVGYDNEAFQKKARAVVFERSSSSDPIDVEKINAQQVDILATAVVGWTGLEDEHGQPIPYSHAKAVELLGDPRLMFVKEQVEAYASKRANFFRKST